MIKFWKTREEYGVFSNFYRCRIFLDGEWWDSTEHYYQAQKTTDEGLKKQIRECKTPKESKNLANSVPLRVDWDDIKYEVMKKAIMAKFSQNESFKQILIGTKNEELVEDSPYDYIWGCGRDGTGQNLLGKVLMEVRETLNTLLGVTEVNNTKDDFVDIKTGEHVRYNDDGDILIADPNDVSKWIDEYPKSGIVRKYIIGSENQRDVVEIESDHGIVDFEVCWITYVDRVCRLRG